MRRKTYYLLCLGICLLSGSLARASETELTIWEFSKDGSNWESVCVPHSWNGADGTTASYFRGKGYYRTVFGCEDPSLPHFIRFEGAAQAADVSVNGSVLCSHKGGYTPFTVSLCGKLVQGENLVEVVCSNVEDPEMAPVTSGFNKNGGLHNPVYLLSLPEVYLDPFDFGFDRFHFVQKDVSRKRALCEVRTTMHNSGGQDARVPVSIVVRDANGRVVKRLNSRLTVPAGGMVSVTKKLRIRKPHLWNGIKDPYLYTVRVEAREDFAEGKTGLRYYSVDKEKGFSLNGDPYPLRGVSMHQDMDGKASALTHEDFDRDYSFVKELGCNFLRLAHYPHNNYAFRLCDSLGMVVQTEIPWVNVCGVRATQAYFDNLHSQTKEMITSLFNHPSIFFWSLWNELDDWGNTEDVQGELDTKKVLDWTEKLYRYAKQLDPFRLVGTTDDSKYRRPGYKGLSGDFFSQNCYYGWYYNKGDFSLFTPYCNWMKDTMGPLNIAEYGVGVNPFCHTWKAGDIRRWADDGYHPEEFGNLFHESHVQQIACMPFLNFTSLWILFDFPVSHRKEGYMDSYDGVHYTENPARFYMNDKGLVTRDRKTRKDVFSLYKALWNKEQTTVYVTGRRLAFRPSGEPFELTVYSNADSLTLYQDGHLVASASETNEVSGVIWHFPDLTMGDKASIFRVVAGDGTEDEVIFQPLITK